VQAGAGLTVDSAAGVVVSKSFQMRKDVKTRVRVRIQERLDELGMTARELGRGVGHDDAWISGILKGTQGLPWKDFDAVAEKLRMSPSELVRHEDAIIRELSPSEMRLLRHFQNWPSTIRDAWLDILEYFVGSMPDRDSEELIARVRKMPRSVRRPVLAWMFRRHCLSLTLAAQSQPEELGEFPRPEREQRDTQDDG